jgi:hypothetical protein
VKIATWSDIPDAIAEAIARADLDRRGGPHQWSIRESVHHLVEANLIAAGMMIAALGKSGSTFDWSWLNPDRGWMTRLGYDRAEVGPALDLLRALCRHVSALLDANPKARQRKVTLFDTPGGKRYTKTIAQILEQEIEHAEEHLRMVREIASQKHEGPRRARP